MALAPVLFPLFADHICVELFHRLGWESGSLGTCHVDIHVPVWMVGLVRCLDCSGGCWVVGVRCCLISFVSF